MSSKKEFIEKINLLIEKLSEDELQEIYNNVKEENCAHKKQSNSLENNANNNYKHVLDNGAMADQF